MRIRARRPATVAAAAVAHPVRFMAFDVLSADGIPTRRLPYRERRELLEDLTLDDRHWACPASLPSDQYDLYSETGARGLEGCIYKRLDEAYTPGKRLWLKAKHLRAERLRVIGWAPGDSGRPERIYLARVLSDGQHSFAGRVEHGLDRAQRRELRAALAAHQLPHRPGRRMLAVASGIEVLVAHHGPRIGEVRDAVLRDIFLPGQSADAA